MVEVIFSKFREELLLSIMMEISTRENSMATDD